MSYKKFPIEYRIVLIERGRNAVPAVESVYVDYESAYADAIKAMAAAERITGVFIYSTHGTGMFIRRDGAAQSRIEAQAENAYFKAHPELNP